MPSLPVVRGRSFRVSEHLTGRRGLDLTLNSRGGSALGHPAITEERAHTKAPGTQKPCKAPHKR